jgi:hypothetical protein
MAKKVDNVIFICIRLNPNTERVCSKGNACGLYSESHVAHQLYRGFIQSLEADTSILGSFNLDHNCILPHPLHFKIHLHFVVKLYIVRVTGLIYQLQISNK